MKNIAIIPARGGSKRIPKKNIKLFNGKPIISYSIKLALESGLFDEVMVSTDDPEIKRISLEYGAKVPFLRSKENSNDYAGIADVIEEVTSHYINLYGNIGHVCCIFATAPLLTVEDLKKGYDLLLTGNFDSIRPLAKFSYPIQRAQSMDHNGFVEFIDQANIKTRSQDLEEMYHDSGSFYWVKKGSKLSSIRRGGFELPQMKVQDIDTMDDWILAELKHKVINGK
ncbi:pseudaminic acid cytidylyltransferase [Flammeovirga sp. MY04]|uniref:pseudaminic acid cytidylyltransferase n=1 Tax=Flammeovirga sp. MY04 TaxID=1191459 RepID=UPI0008063B4B|nr:pseudaminic acid cytidylyltransferase [Flammeovirga sp. MY04]ANQ50239.1 pseudaminic acid cytidylyltransferase [Flammeovirga sp. MY04]